MNQMICDSESLIIFNHQIRDTYAVEWVARKDDNGGWYISNRVTDKANVEKERGQPEAYLRIKHTRRQQEEYNLIVKVIPITCNIIIIRSTIPRNVEWYTIFKFST